MVAISMCLSGLVGHRACPWVLVHEALSRYQTMIGLYWSPQYEKDTDKMEQVQWRSLIQPESGVHMV